MKHLRLSLLIAVSAFFAPFSSAQDTRFICGVDVSFLQQIETAGGVYTDENDQPVEALTFLRDQGVNMVRLRLWHSPDNGVNDLAHTLEMATRIHALDMDLLLDLHYSDTWADPGHQTKPSAWADLSFTELTDAVYSYTYDVIAALRAQGTPPAIVQIGNEITGGFLWEEGRVQGDENWAQLIALLNAGVNGVHDALESDSTVQIMLHIDPQRSAVTSQWFFDHIGDQVDFDLIGLSYYPWWQGDFATFTETIIFVAKRYGRPVIIAETAYPWTLEWSDNTHNPVGEQRQLLPDYPATPQGQSDFLHHLTDTLKSVPDDLGRGFFYWEPDAISTTSFGSSWENLAQFDFEGRALPSLSIYGECGG